MRPKAGLQGNEVRLKVLVGGAALVVRWRKPRHTFAVTLPTGKSSLPAIRWVSFAACPSSYWPGLCVGMLDALLAAN